MLVHGIGAAPFVGNIACARFMFATPPIGGTGAPRPPIGGTPPTGGTPPIGGGGGGTPPPPTYTETVGGVAHTWTNYTNAGGTEGPSIASNATVQIACKLTGFKVADGNTWW